MSENMILKIKELLDLGFSHEQVAQMIGNEREEEREKELKKEKKDKKEKTKRKKSQKTYPIKDKEKWQLFLSYLNDRDKLFAYLTISNGLRGVDTRYTQLKDVLHALEEDSFEEVVERKTGKSKNIYIESYKQEILTLLDKMNITDPEQYLFVSTRPKQSGEEKGQYTVITRQGLLKNIQRAATLAGIKERIGIHSFRKTYAFWFYVSNENALAYLMKALNHSSEAVTLSYIGITDDEIRKYANKGLSALKGE